MYAGCYIDEQLAVKMIQLMLDAAGEQARCRQMLKLATAVQELDLYLLGTLNNGEKGTISPTAKATTSSI